MDQAVVYLVIIEDKRYIVAHTMDGARNLEEELDGMGFQPVFRQWIDESLEEVVLGLIDDGKSLPVCT